MKRKTRHSNLSPVALAAGLLLTALPVSGQLIFNGDHDFFWVQETWPEGFRVAFGENQDGTLTLHGSEIDSNFARLADSDGTGTVNQAEMHLRDATFLEFMNDGEFSHFGYDGDAVVTIEGGSTLRTRRARLATLPGSSATLTLDGAGNNWHQSSFAVEVGLAGSGEVNVRNGASISVAQNFVIGGSMFGDLAEAGGTGVLDVRDPGSVIDFANSDFARLAIGSGGTGTVTVANGAAINVTGNNDAYDLWVGRREGGTGTLNITGGGTVTADGVFRIASVNANSSTVTVDGSGSALTIEQEGYIGNTGTEGTTGTLTISNGGAVSLNSFLRIGNQTDATGVVTVAGNNSALTVDTFIHIGYNGTGTVNILNGGKVTGGLRPETTFGVFLGRLADSSGTVNVQGTGSELDATHSLFLGATADDEVSGGAASLSVSDNGTVRVGSNLNIRGQSSVSLDDGTIHVGSLARLRDESSLTGEGTLIGDLEIEAGATLQGSGLGIHVTGTLSGTGTVQNATLRTLHSVASVGPLTLENVGFYCPVATAVNIVVDDLNAENLISFDLATAFVCAALTVSFQDIDPSGKASFVLFDFTGSGDPDYDFFSVTVPEGWFFEDGILYNENVVPSSAFEEWAASHGLSGDDAEPGADPDGDGFTNEEEFAFGTNPTIPTTALVQISRDGSILTLRWNRRESGIDYAIQKATDLGDWNDVVGAEPVVMTAPDVEPPAGYERVEWSVDIAGEGSRAFYRVTADIDPSAMP